MSSRVEQILNGETVKPQSRVEELLEDLVDLADSPISYNDLTDRTHYEYVQHVVIAGEQLIKDRRSLLSEIDGYYDAYGYLIGTSIVAGDRYIIAFDGVDYECVAGVESNYVCLFGTGSSFGGAPFNISAPLSSLTKRCTFRSQDGGEHTVKLTHVAGELKPLDDKFIPDTVARKSDTLSGVITNGTFVLESNTTLLAFDEIIPDEFRLGSNLQTVALPNSTSIGYNSFGQCSKLEILYAPKVIDIGEYAFKGCVNLAEINLPMTVTIGVDSFANCYSLETVDLSSVASISNGSFGRCYSLKNVILRSESLCALDDVSAFFGCNHIEGTVNSTYNPDGLKDGYIYVPKSLIGDYKTATNWSTFASQFRALEDYTVDGTVTGELDEEKTV